jgi:formate hydrogenlyase subunit 6/NADH:ubiquinone oxidoreductase subunit I
MTGPAVLERAHFQHLLDVLRAGGYRIVGPTVRDAAIVYDEIERVDDLPVGWTDEQAPGRYRLKPRSDRALFGYVVGPHSWKKYLHPPAERLWRATRNGKTFSISAEPTASLKYAFVGVRACELRAIGILDQVMTGGVPADPSYAARRSDAFILAVNCVQAGGACFCVSMQTGPRAASGFDLALTELIAATEHVFLVETGSERGAEILDQVPHRPASEQEITLARGKIEAAAAQMGRSLDTTGLKELLYRNYEHPRWDEVAQRCLTCANCTMVCPTCFCTTVEDVTDLSGEHAERWRKWDSCFTLDFSHIHGGSVRASGRSRYRHWMVHKLATWFDQFGSSGCVGCGRCIAWCPVGIDITEEARAIRASERLPAGGHDETA